MPRNNVIPLPDGKWTIIEFSRRYWNSKTSLCVLSCTCVDTLCWWITMMPAMPYFLRNTFLRHDLIPVVTLTPTQILKYSQRTDTSKPTPCLFHTSQIQELFITKLFKTSPAKRYKCGYNTRKHAIRSTQCHVYSVRQNKFVRAQSVIMMCVTWLKQEYAKFWL